MKDFQARGEIADGRIRIAWKKIIILNRSLSLDSFLFTEIL
jgi:hypothetical protein